MTLAIQISANVALTPLVVETSHISLLPVTHLQAFLQHFEVTALTFHTFNAFHGLIDAISLSLIPALFCAVPGVLLVLFMCAGLVRSKNKSMLSKITAQGNISLLLTIVVLSE